MKLLIDNALSPLVAQGLMKHGVDAVHVRDVGLQHASDRAIFDFAFQHDYWIVSADTDFGALLANWSECQPSFILLRRVSGHHPRQQLNLLLANLPALRDDLEQGCVVVLEEHRIRIRSLPF